MANMGDHPECHLEFLKVFNGDKMTSIAVLNVYQNATKLFGLRHSLVFKSPLFNNVIFPNSGGHLGCSPYSVCLLALISMIQLSNTSELIFKSLSKYDYFHGNYCFPYTGSHLGRHLEFLKLLNGGIVNVEDLSFPNM